MRTESEVRASDVMDLPLPLALGVLRGEISLALARQLHQEYPWLPCDVADRLIKGTTSNDDRHFIEVMSKLDANEAQRVIDEFSWMPWDMLVRMIENSETEQDRDYVRRYHKIVASLPSRYDYTKEHEVRAELMGIIERDEQRLTNQINQIIVRSQDYLERQIRENFRLLDQQGI